MKSELSVEVIERMRLAGGQGTGVDRRRLAWGCGRSGGKVRVTETVLQCAGIGRTPDATRDACAPRQPLKRVPLIDREGGGQAPTEHSVNQSSKHGKAVRHVAGCVRKVS